MVHTLNHYRWETEAGRSLCEFYANPMYIVSLDQLRLHIETLSKKKKGGRANKTKQERHTQPGEKKRSQKHTIHFGPLLNNLNTSHVMLTCYKYTECPRTTTLSISLYP